MQMRQINVETLTEQFNHTADYIQKSDLTESYLVIGKPGLRSKKKNNRIAYLTGNELEQDKSSTLAIPKMHTTKEGVTLCECPDFCYTARTLEAKLMQAMSLELAMKLAQPIKGLVIVIDSQDFITSRGDQFKNLVKVLGDLCKTNFFRFFLPPLSCSQASQKKRMIRNLSYNGFLLNYANHNNCFSIKRSFR